MEKQPVSKIPTPIMIGIVVIVVIVGFIVLKFFKKDSPPSPPPDVSVVEPIPDDDLQGVTPGTIPDLTKGDYPHAVGETVTDDSLKETVLNEKEIGEHVLKTLDGIRLLDPASISFISPTGLGGEANPFYYMLKTAEANPAIKELFLTTGTLSSVEILQVRKVNSGYYNVTMAATTPYLPPLTQGFLAGKGDNYEDTVSVDMSSNVPLAASGLATNLATADLSEIPLTTDVVVIVVVIKEDIPYVFHPYSLTFGTQIPQYAFLWGGEIYEGIKNEDLLVSQILMDAQAVEETVFSENASNKIILAYLRETIDFISAGNIEGFMGQGIKGELLLTKSLGNLMHQLNYKVIDYPFLGEDMKTRLLSLEYSCTFYQQSYNADNTNPVSFIIITYSWLDQSTDKRVYAQEYFELTGKLDAEGILPQNKFALSIINNRLVTIFETVLIGGDSSMDDRVYLENAQKP